MNSALSGHAHPNARVGCGGQIQGPFSAILVAGERTESGSGSFSARSDKSHRRATSAFHSEKSPKPNEKGLLEADKTDTIAPLVPKKGPKIPQNNNNMWSTSIGAEKTDTIAPLVLTKGPKIPQMWSASIGAEIPQIWSTSIGAEIPQMWSTSNKKLEKKKQKFPFKRKKRKASSIFHSQPSRKRTKVKKRQKQKIFIQGCE